jgi:hypothetical protein
VDIAPLEPAAPGQPRRLLVASWAGPHTRIAILDKGIDSGIHEKVNFRADGLVAFAPDAWAVHRVGHFRRRQGPDEEGRTEQAEDQVPDWDQFVVQRLSGNKIDTKEVEDWDTLRYQFIDCVTQGPGQSLYAEFYTGDGGRDYDFSPYGQISAYIFSPDGKVIRTGTWSEKDFGERNYGEDRELVCNDQFGLLFWCSLVDRVIVALPLDLMAPPRELPEGLQVKVPGANYHDDRPGPLHGLRLSDGRSLLVYHAGLLILESDGRSVGKIGKPDAIREPQRIIVGVAEGGKKLICAEVSPENRTSHEVFVASVLLDPREPSVATDVTGFTRPARDGTRYRLVRRVEERMVGGLELLVEDESATNESATAELWDMATVVSRLRKPDNPLPRLSVVSYDVLDLTRGDANRWHLEVAVCLQLDPGERSRGGPSGPDTDTILRVYTVGLVADGEHSPLLDDLVPIKLVEINLGRKWVTALTAIGPDYLALACENGPIEVIAATPGPDGGPQVQALGFTLTPPTDLATLYRDGSPFLVAVAGDEVWFNLSGVAGL